ncbi:MAG: hypothetical protein E7630_03210 [Ruminococcaceae bacterium]|nr:hypothetical protein [Oscillospiraceae bacterium]
MSLALFHDTVTLYLTAGDDAAPERRVIRNVRTVLTKTADKGVKAQIWLPLWGRRDLAYRPDDWDGRKDRFTVRVGDALVCCKTDPPLPPEEALTVKTVICRTGGSRRLWHLEIEADDLKDEEETKNEGTEA